MVWLSSPYMRVSESDVNRILKERWARRDGGDRDRSNSLAESTRSFLRESSHDSHLACDQTKGGRKQREKRKKEKREREKNSRSQKKADDDRRREVHRYPRGVCVHV